MSLDDRAARRYFEHISAGLAARNIATNNIIADPFNEPAFSMPNMVTLSTVYRAKGNEASAVFAIGVDAVNRKTRAGRNKIFTAFTRTKAWLRVSGVQPLAENIFSELKKAMKHVPQMKFTMPDLDKIETIQRDLTKKQLRAKAAWDELKKKLKAAGYSDEEIEEELQLGGRLDS